MRKKQYRQQAHYAHQVAGVRPNETRPECGVVRHEGYVGDFVHQSLLERRGTFPPPPTQRSAPPSAGGRGWPMIWQLSHRADVEVLPLVDRHYSRQKPGSPQFAPPGRCIVLKAKEDGIVKAVWGSSWPFAQYVKHAWAGAWQCFIFRNEGPWLSSGLITQAVAATRAVAMSSGSWEWGRIPDLGMVTFVDADKTRPKPNPGWCYRKAGWKILKATTKGGLVVAQLLPDEMPEPVLPVSGQRELFALTSAPRAPRPALPRSGGGHV
jgi:hypothetical protein